MHSTYLLVLVGSILAPTITAAPQWGTTKQAPCDQQPYPYNVQCQQSQPAPKQPARQPQPAAQPAPDSRPYPYNLQTPPPGAAPQSGAPGVLSTPGGGAFIQNDASGLTMKGPLGTYHKGPDGTYMESALGAYGTAPDGSSMVKGGLGTIVSGPKGSGSTYQPKGFGTTRGG